jgi:acyl-CoA hydrolase
MNWQDQYRRKTVSPQEAIECIQSGMRVYIHPGCAEPEALVEALMARGPFVKNVEIVHILTLGRADYIAPQMEGHFRHNATFIGEMTWPQYRDGGFTGPVAKMFGVTAIPHTSMIDADGVLQEEHVGDASIEGKLKKLLAQAQDR